jgi:hypothetical protein
MLKFSGYSCLIGGPKRKIVDKHFDKEKRDYRRLQENLRRRVLRLLRQFEGTIIWCLLSSRRTVATEVSTEADYNNANDTF